MASSHLEAPPTPEALYERSRALAVDLGKLALTLATGLLGAFFFVLVRAEHPHITRGEHWIVLAALACIAVSVALGLVGWAAQATFYSSWAQHVHEKGNYRELGAWLRNNRWGRIRCWSLVLAAILFSIGAALTAVFIVSFSGRS